MPRYIWQIENMGCPFLFIHQNLTLLCVQFLLFVLLYHINIALLILNGLFYFPSDFCVNHLDVSYWPHLVMVSCFVIEEDSLVGYLSFSVCLLLTMQMEIRVQACGTKHAPCCAVQRQPAHGEQLRGCGTVFAFLWFSCEEKVGSFQVCFVLLEGNRRRQPHIMTASPPSLWPHLYLHSCVLTDFAT